MSPPRVATARRHFHAALIAALLLCVLFLLLLSGPFSSGTRETISSAGFVLGALAIAAGGSFAARRCSGRRRRAWIMLVSAAGLALVGNGWTTLTGGDPVRDPSIVGEVCTAAALVLSIFGLLGLPDAPARHRRLLVQGLDGLVTGCAVLIIATVLVFSRLVESQSIAERPVVILFPLLDVAVATVAVLLIVRSEGNRSFFSLVGLGFIAYAVGDLVFAVQSAQLSFVVGTPQDVIWISGYLLLAAAPWHPDASGAPEDKPSGQAFDVQGTVLVFALLVVAAAVQSMFPGGPLTESLTGLWVVLVLAVGVRQTLLVADNVRLRGRLEAQVRERTADLRRITRQTEVMLTSVGDGIYGVDLDGRITFVNPSASRMLRHQAPALLGKRAHDAFHAAETDGRVHDGGDCYVGQAIRDGLVSSGREDVYRRVDSTTFPVEITASPLVDDSRISGAVVVFRDVTQRREVDRMKDEFLSIVSHELRTPLTSIRGSLGMLGSGVFKELTPQAERMVAIAVQSSERLARLINDILDIERIRSGKLPMNLVRQQAATLVRGTVKEMSGLAESAGLRIEVGPSSGEVLADEDRIMQTLTNLVGNAVKFSPAGGVVRIEAVNGDEQVTFAVRDEGRGIPVDKLESIFEPFEQVDSSDSREKGGTGLGLAISRGIVERHGGRIWAESDGDQGAAVRFSLPRAGRSGSDLPTAATGRSPSAARPMSSDTEMPDMVEEPDSENEAAGWEPHGASAAHGGGAGLG